MCHPCYSFNWPSMSWNGQLVLPFGCPQMQSVVVASRQDPKFKQYNILSFQRAGINKPSHNNVLLIYCQAYYHILKRITLFSKRILNKSISLLSNITVWSKSYTSFCKRFEEKDSWLKRKRSKSFYLGHYTTHYNMTKTMCHQ